MIKIIGIVVLGIIWYLIIGAFVTAMIYKMDGASSKEINEEGEPVIVLTLAWPLVAIVLIFMELGKLIKIISTGAYNLLNKPEKKEATTIYDDYTITTTIDDDYESNYKKIGGNAKILEITEAIEKAIDECEKKYGVKIKWIMDIFSGGYEKTYIDFMADNGKTYCLEIPVSIKDSQRWMVLHGWITFKEREQE